MRKILSKIYKLFNVFIPNEQEQEFVRKFENNPLIVSDRGGVSHARKELTQKEIEYYAWAEKVFKRRYPDEEYQWHLKRKKELMDKFKEKHPNGAEIDINAKID